MKMRRLGLRSLLLAMASVLLFAAPAAAQDDPYGPTTTTTTDPGSLVPNCELGLEAALPGASATLIVRNVPPGGVVRVIIGGEEAGRATAPLQGQSAGSPVLLGGIALPAQSAVTDLEVPFVVPDLSPGLHLVTAVGANFTITCDTENIEVLATQQGRRPASGSLAFTGIYLGLFLVVALALFLIGRALLKASRRRREALGAAPRDERGRTLTRSK